MQITLLFNEDEKDDAQLAIHAFKLKNVLDELDNKLRAMAKYEDKTTIKITDARQLVGQLIKDNDIEFLFWP